MKLFIFSILLVQAAAFSIVSQQPRAATTLFSTPADDYTPGHQEGKINLQMDLDSKKVVHKEEIESGKKVFCRCWLSTTFPMCDGTHEKHNEATGDNVGPVIVSVKKA